MLPLLAPLFFSLAMSSGPPQIVILPSEPDPDGSPTQTAAVCIDDHRESCWIPGAHIFRKPKLEEINLGKGQRAYFYKVEGIGGSGWPIILALLRVEKNGKLRNLLPQMPLTNASEHQLWKIGQISSGPLLVVADFIWEQDEAHYAPHRYEISVYSQRGAGEYKRVLRYDTLGKYDPNDENVLESERARILARLRRTQDE